VAAGSGNAAERKKPGSMRPASNGPMLRLKIASVPAPPRAPASDAMNIRLPFRSSRISVA
jgi:hypothetical protein